MASGHVNRIQRPNTWLQRPMLQNREESSCQTGAVHTWHRVDGRKNDRPADFRSGSSTDLLAPKSDLPLYPRKQTSDGPLVTSVLCRYCCKSLFELANENS